MYGSSSKGGIKVYESDALDNKYLITSNQTVFSVEYLYEMTLQILHSNATFLALADIFQALHVFNRHSIARADVNRKRIIDAWVLFLLSMLRIQIYMEETTWLEKYNALIYVLFVYHVKHCIKPI